MESMQNSILRYTVSTLPPTPGNRSRVLPGRGTEKESGTWVYDVPPEEGRLRTTPSLDNQKEDEGKLILGVVKLKLKEDPPSDNTVRDNSAHECGSRVVPPLDENRCKSLQEWKLKA